MAKPEKHFQEKISVEGMLSDMQDIGCENHILNEDQVCARCVVVTGGVGNFNRTVGDFLLAPCLALVHWNVDALQLTSLLCKAKGKALFAQPKGARQWGSTRKFRFLTQWVA